jgi:acetyl esterase/lipase
MKTTIAVLVISLLTTALPVLADDSGAKPASAKDAQHAVIPVWPGIAPGSEGWTQKEVDYENSWDHRKMVRNVTTPTLTVYLPDPAKANGTAVIIAPGGGFRFLSWENEGLSVAQWLADRGVTAFVLKYRLLDTGESQEEFLKSRKPGTTTSASTQPAKPIDIAALASADGRAAMKLVRQRAAEWKIAPDRIGFMGFSAGGVVTMGVVLEHDADSRPNFAAPIYGPGPAAAVPADAMPLFILCAGDDKGAMPGSVRLCLDWKAAGHPAELHIYSKGGHGFGMAQRGLPIDHWIDRLGDWMTVNGWMRK